MRLLHAETAGACLDKKGKKREREQKENTPRLLIYIFLLGAIRDLKKEKCTKSIIYLRDSSWTAHKVLKTTLRGKKRAVMMENDFFMFFPFIESGPSPPVSMQK